MKKTFSKSYVLLQLELTLNYIVLNNCLLPTTCCTYAEDSDIRVTSLRDRKLTTLNNTTQQSQCREKNVSSATMKRRLCEADLNGRIAVNKPLLRKQSNVNRHQWAWAHNGWTTEQWNKVLWTDESKFEILGSNRKVYERRTVGERAVTSYITPTVKHALLWGEGFLPIAKSGICSRGATNWIKLWQHTAASCNPI